MIAGFVKAYGFTLLLVAALGFQYLQTRDLRAQLANALVSQDLLRKALEARATPEKPIVVSVPVPGGGGTTTPVNVFVQPPQPAVPAAPGRPAQPAQPPRLVTEAPPVFCRTEAECRRILAAAPQAITADAEITVGTVATVCLDPLGPQQSCADSRRANLPLAVPIKFQARFVLTDRGVFQGLNVEGSSLTITRVRTETAIDVPLPAPSLPYHLGLEAGFLGSQFFTGPVYTNRAFGGYYRLAAGWGWSPSGAGFAAGAFFTLPIR